MSIKVMTWYWEHSKQEGHKLLALLALSDWCTDDGECFPSIRTLAKRIRRDERSAQRVVNELEKAGELVIYPGMGKGSEGRRSPLYYLMKYRDAHNIEIAPMIMEAARYYRQLDRKNGRKGLEVRKAQALLTGDTDVTPTGDTDVTPTGDTDVTPTGDTDVTQIRHIDPSLDPSAPKARVSAISNDVSSPPPAPPPATPGAPATVEATKKPLLPNDGYEMRQPPASKKAPSGEPTQKQLQRWAPQVDPRKFRNGYIPTGAGATPVEVWYESFAVTDAQSRLTAPDQDDLRGLADLDRLRKIVATFRRCGFKRPKNIQLILDWYQNGIPEKYLTPPNGAAPTPPPAERVLDFNWEDV